MLITWLARARAELGVKALVQFSALVAWVPQRPGSSLLRWRLMEPPGRVLVTGDPWDYSSGLLVSTVAWVPPWTQCHGDWRGGPSPAGPGVRVPFSI